jgi:hypothetical protein
LGFLKHTNKYVFNKWNNMSNNLIPIRLDLIISQRESCVTCCLPFLIIWRNLSVPLIFINMK